MQLNDEELDKKLEDLDNQRKELYEIATKTDKKKEKRSIFLIMIRGMFLKTNNRKIF